MSDAWDLNAEARHEQIRSGRDVSLSQVLVPAILDIIISKGSWGTARVLEVGCGTGFLTKRLAELAGSIVAIDPSSESVRIARDYLGGHDNVEFLDSSIETFEPTRGEAFDLVVSSMALQALPDLDAAIESISGLLKPGCTFVFAIPHPCFWPTYKGLASSDGYQYHRASQHSIPFTISNDRNPLPARVPFYHRPLQQYGRALAANSMAITSVVEPFPKGSVAAMFDEPWEYPHFLILECSMPIG